MHAGSCLTLTRTTLTSNFTDSTNVARTRIKAVFAVNWQISNNQTRRYLNWFLWGRNAAFVVSLSVEIFRSMLYTIVLLLFLAVNMVQNTHQYCTVHSVPLLQLPMWQPHLIRQCAGTVYRCDVIHVGSSVSSFNLMSIFYFLKLNAVPFTEFWLLHVAVLRTKRAISWANNRCYCLFNISHYPHFLVSHISVIRNAITWKLSSTFSDQLVIHSLSIN